MSLMTIDSSHFNFVSSMKTDFEKLQVIFKTVSMVMSRFASEALRAFTQWEPYKFHISHYTA